VQHSTNQMNHSNHGTSIFLTTQQASEYLGLAVSTLNKWRVYGKGPKFIKLGRAVRYRLDDLTAFTSACSRSSTSEV